MAAKRAAKTATEAHAPDAAEKPDALEAGPDPSPGCGFIGHAPGADDNAAHTLVTGPDSPSLPDDRTRVNQPPAPKEA